MLLIAHRGASSTHPENTEAAFDAALKTGIDGFELDVRLCADGVVVCHDADLSRFGGAPTPLVQRSRADLAACDVGSWKSSAFHGQGVMDLDLLLDRYGGRTLLFIELKPPADEAGARRLTETVVDAIVSRELIRQCLLLSFDLQALAWARKRAELIGRVWNRTDPPKELGQAREAGIHIIDCALDRLTPEAVDAMHASNLLAAAYSANDERELAHARACGLDVLMSDRPEWLIQAGADLRE